MTHDDGLTDRWTDIFRRDPGIHLALMLSIVAGTLQGWIKDRIGGPIPYVLADGLLLVAVLIWFAGLAVRHASVRGPGATVPVMLTLVAVPALFLLHPGTPLAVEIAGLRAWVAFPLAGLIGLTLFRSRGQVAAYIGLILILCTITAVYGIWQYTQGPEGALATTLAQARHGATVFYGSGGEAQFRAFSTFTFPAPFATMMVFGILLAVGLATAPERQGAGRWFPLVLTPLFFVGMTVSGTRAAVVVLALGLLILAWYRGFSFAQLVAVAVLLGAFHFATVVTTGAAVSRLASITAEGRLWSSVLSPVIIAYESLQTDPFGLGLGRSGVGVPFQVFQSAPAGFFRGADGDIARAAVELGVFGVALFGLILIAIVPWIFRATRALRGTESEPYALALGTMLGSVLLGLVIGSPLTSVPHATIWWLFFGALLRMMLDEESQYSDHDELGVHA